MNECFRVGRLLQGWQYGGGGGVTGDGIMWRRLAISLDRDTVASQNRWRGDEYKAYRGHRCVCFNDKKWLRIKDEGFV
jgi:hypothetical protein